MTHLSLIKKQKKETFMSTIDTLASPLILPVDTAPAAVQAEDAQPTGTLRGRSVEVATEAKNSRMPSPTRNGTTPVASRTRSKSPVPTKLANAITVAQATIAAPNQPTSALATELPLNKDEEKQIEEKKPETVVNQPAVEEKKAETVVNEPVVEEKKAETEVNKPAVEEKKAEAEVNKPAVEEKKAETVVNEPVVEEKKAETEVNKPAVEEKKAEAEVNKPAVEEKKPETEVKNKVDAKANESKKTGLVGPRVKALGALIVCPVTVTYHTVAFTVKHIANILLFGSLYKNVIVDEKTHEQAGRALSWVASVVNLTILPVYILTSTVNKIIHVFSPNTTIFKRINIL
jgi:hypothetical protein